MKLEIGNFYVKDIVFGDKTSYKDGILTVNQKEAVEALNPEGNLKNVELYIVRPGEKTRILPIKEIVEARVRPDGRALFPGQTGQMALSGDGKIYALKNMAVTAVGVYAGNGDGMLDMDGPAAELTYFSEMMHLCFKAENTDDSENVYNPYKKNTYYRLGAQLLAEYIGKAVLGQEPQEWEIFDNTTEGAADLPRVAMVLQISAAFVKEPGFVCRLYGQDVINLVPTMLNANELLDGALCADTLFFASFKLYTYDYQNMPLIKELYAEHGKSLNFVGVFLDVNPAVADLKVRASDRIAVMAQMMKLDGAVVVNTGNGHSEIDFFTTIIKLEEAGVKCVGQCMESPGHGGGMQSKVMLDARADAIVSTGADHVVLNLPAMDKVIGEIDSVNHDGYPGAWAYDPEYGPSLHEDGSLVVDSLIIAGHDGNAGWSHKVCKSY